jgi:hypothetical protein
MTRRVDCAEVFKDHAHQALFGGWHHVIPNHLCEPARNMAQFCAVSLPPNLFGVGSIGTYLDYGAKARSTTPAPLPGDMASRGFWDPLETSVY